jgi:hypothetical protein
MAGEGEKLLRPPTEAGPLFALHYVRLGAFSMGRLADGCKDTIRGLRGTPETLRNSPEVRREWLEVG